MNELRDRCSNPECLLARAHSGPCVTAKKKTKHSDDWEAWSETVEADSSPYIVHHTGPDDIYPARSWREAVEISYDINTSVLEYVHRTENDGWVMSWATPYRRDVAKQVGVI